MQNSVIKISEKLSEFVGQESKIANYIIKNPREASKLTITEFSKKVNVSPSTITRFCIHLGYKGYKELSKDLFVSAINISSNNLLYDVNSKFAENMNLHDIISAVSKVNIDSIIKTQKIIDEEELLKAVDMLDKRNAVSILATSGSVSVAQDAAFKFNRLGLRCVVFDYSHDQILAASKLTPNDVALFISYSGENKSLIDAIRIMKSRKVNTIAITKYGNNTIFKEANCNIQHSNLGTDKKTFSTRSRVVQENIIDIIFIALRQRREKELQEYYKLFEKK